MREIKFRAWHKEEKVMCDVDVINLNKGAFLIGVKLGNDQVSGKYFVPAPQDGRFCYFDEIELVEYTGLKDKNGVDIYEGDIVRGDLGFSFQVKGVVQYGGLAFSYIGKTSESKEWQYTITSKDIYIDVMIEVIGNIYENPELIK